MSSRMVAQKFEESVRRCVTRRLSRKFHYKHPAKWASSHLNTVIILLCFFLLLVTFWENTTHGFAFLASRPPGLFVRNVHSLRRYLAVAAAPDPPLNTFLTLEDSDAWYCSEFQRQGSYRRRSFEEWVRANASDEEVFCAAHRAALQPLPEASGTPPRVAFLFMVRGPIPLEPLWRKFFQGHESLYSIYVHPGGSNYSYSNNSIFHQRQIPSKPVGRLAITMPEAQRRLLAYALLDSTVPNAWFSLVCDAAIPVRSFGFVYNYLMNSELSFVEAFLAWEWWRQGWTTETRQLRDDVMRKGEAWFSVHRRHAGLIVGDFFVFPKFKEHWREGVISVEVYLPTLLNIVDPLGIANHSTTYVNWSNPETESHPVMYTSANFTKSTILAIQNQTQNTDGMYAMSTRVLGWDNEESCVYNGVPNSSCWLFARKFSGEPEDVEAILGFTDILIGD
ncbi:unnamed protein product [Sphagnum jensenii]|uniref:Uncharacterized protein n=1 Tax=Sphagnum jensenii TaxID=128206 RepID=A0ABP0XFD4_9BRYO